MELRTGNILYNILDSITGDYNNYMSVITKPNGSAFTDADVDGKYITKKGSEYFRLIHDGPCNAQKLGMIGDGVTDNYAVMRQIFQNKNLPNDIYIPPGNYYCSNTISVRKPMRIRGTSNWMGTTGGTIIFASGKDGFVFERYNTPIGLGNGGDLGNGSDGSEISNLTLVQQAPIKKGHAIWAHCRINVKDVAISNWGGDGIHIEANYQPSNLYTTIQKVYMNDRGANYTTAPSVSITGDGTGAIGHAVLGGKVASWTITNGGLFSDLPSISVFDGQPFDTAGYGASFNAIMGVANPVITNGGSGYTNATVTFSNGYGVVAKGTAQITNGSISGILMTDRGTKYPTMPIITITGDGTGATATAFLTIVDLEQTNTGDDYEVVPTVYTAGGMGNGATGGAVITLTLGQFGVKRIEIDKGGINYTTADIVISGGGGSGALATPVVTSQIEGNANNWKVENVRTVNCANGLFVSGGDTNSGYAVGFSATSCRLNGVWDNSFLGNKYIGCHTEENKLHPYYSTQYAAVNDFDNCYSEGGQLPSFGHNLASFRGGDHGAGIDARNGCKIEGIIDNYVKIKSSGNSDTINIVIGGNADNHEIENISNKATPAGAEIRRKIDPVSGDITMDVANTFDRGFYYLTNTNTNVSFGRSKPVPYATYFPRLFVGQGAIRQICASPSFPPIKSPLQTEWAAGDFVFNASPTIAAGVIGWHRVTNGSSDVLGTDWLEVKIGSGGSAGSADNLQARKLTTFENATGYTELIHQNRTGSYQFPASKLLGYGGAGVYNFALVVASGNATGATQIASILEISTNADSTQAASKQLMLYITENYGQLTTAIAEGGSVIELRLGGSAGGAPVMTIKPNGHIMAALPTFADEAAATTGGLVTNEWYKTATGEVRIKL